MFIVFLFKDGLRLNSGPYFPHSAPHSSPVYNNSRPLVVQGLKKRATGRSPVAETVRRCARKSLAKHGQPSRTTSSTSWREASSDKNTSACRTAWTWPRLSTWQTHKSRPGTKTDGRLKKTKQKKNTHTHSHTIVIINITTHTHTHTQLILVLIY